MRAWHRWISITSVGVLCCPLIGSTLAPTPVLGQQLRLAPVVPAENMPPPLADEPSATPTELETGDSAVDTQADAQAGRGRGTAAAVLTLLAPPAPQQATPPAPQPAPQPATPPAPTGVETPATEPAKPDTLEELAGRPAAVGYRGLVPGQATKDDAIEELGAPQSETPFGAGQVLGFAINDLPAVEVEVNEAGTITAIRLQLDGDETPEQIAARLKAAEFRPVDVRDSEGRRIAVAYPERAIVISLAPPSDAAADQASKRRRATQVRLEPLNAELYVLRARQESPAFPTRRLDDLEEALRLAPRDAEACGVKARVLHELGEDAEALSWAERAREGDPDSTEWSLLIARVEVRRHRPEVAGPILRELLERAELHPLAHAEALLLQANLATLRNEQRAAYEHRRQAIELAAPLRGSTQAETRRGALRLLTEAYLGTAADIAWGDWSDKDAAVRAWVENGHQLARQLLVDEQEDPLLVLLFHRQTLEAYLPLETATDIEPICAEAFKQARGLLSRTEDARLRRRVEWQLSETMCEALRQQCARGDYDAALPNAQSAYALLEEAQRRRELTAREQYLLAQLAFSAGACQSLGHQDHAAAVAWFDRALPHFPAASEESPELDPGMLGDQCLSMGVSYWRTRRSDPAIEATTRGIEFLERAVESEPERMRSLVLGCRNLAQMLAGVGRDDEAADWRREAEELSKSARR